MARPKPLTHLASSTTSPSSSTPTPRCHSPSSQPASAGRLATIHRPAPSTTLLALLATVAASSSAADGRPLTEDSQPPDFLCPLLASDPSLDRQIRNNHLPDSEESGSGIYYLSPTPTRKKRRRSFVPDKYVQGDDGRWRKEPSWSLYGSSYCDCAEDSVPPQTPAPEIDDQIDPSQPAIPPSTTVHHTTTSTEMTAADLPLGWKTTDDRDDWSVVVVIVAVLAAIFICSTIFGCVNWRRKRRAHAQKDPEKKLRRLKDMENEDEGSEAEELKRTRSQHRFWAKAPAKWRVGVRISARRRKRRTPIVLSQDFEPQISTDSLTTKCSYTTSEVSGPTFTDHSSPHLQSTLDSDTHVNGDSSQGHSLTPSAFEDTLEAPRPAQPPQYAEGTPILSQAPRSSEEGRLLYSDSSAAQSLNAATEAHGTDAPPLDDPDIPYVATAAAHIATDDKTLLSRMANFASAPPTESGSSLHDSSHGEMSTGPSVPVLDEFEDLPDELQLFDDENSPHASPTNPSSDWDRMLLSSTPLTSGLSSLSARLPAPTYSRDPSPNPLRSRDGSCVFPSPPSKPQLSTSLFYDYPSSFEEDVQGTEPVSVPSAPPFDFVCPGPSAPPGEILEAAAPDAVPCAPPLIDEEEEVQLGLTRTATAPFFAEEEVHVRDEADSTLDASFGDDGATCRCQGQSGLECSCGAATPTGSSPSANVISHTTGVLARGRPLSQSTSRTRAANPPDYLP